MPDVRTSTRPQHEGAGESPKVSVIVPIYNCEPYVAQCLGSLAEQTMASIEVLCVDDASTDDSLSRARAAVEGDCRFRFFQLPENRGQSAARNVALDYARGEYLVLLDSDDYLVPNAIEKLIGRADAQQLDDLYFSGRSFYEDARAHELVREDYSDRPDFEGVASGIELFTFFEERDRFFPQAPLRMVRRDLVEREAIRFYEGIIHEDLLFTLQTLLASKRSSFLNEELYMRRVRMGSTMVQPRRTIANVHGHFVCLRELQAWLDDNPDKITPPFASAVAHRIAAYRFMMAYDWNKDISPDQRQAYLDSLSVTDRLAFLRDVVYPGDYIQELYDSKTYRFGDAILSVPRALRDKLTEMRRYRKER